MSKPKIRFKGYEEDWEQRKLGDLVDVLDGDRGKNYPTSDDFDISGHTIFLNASNVTNNGFLFQDNQFITEEKSNNMGNGKLEEDDIVITSRGSLGHIAWYNADISSLMPYARINSGMLILRNKKEIETEYLYHFMKSDKGQSQISFISFGSAQPQLTKKGVEDLKVILPTRRDEQTQLGHCFSSLDHLITLHQRKCEETKKLKKYMLQKMFPQNGKRVPEIRFAGFTDDWEQRKLGDVTELKSASRVHKGEWTDSGVPFFRSSDVMAAINGTTNEKAYISEELYEKLSNASGKLEEGDVLVTGGGSVGNPYIVPNNEPLYTKDADLLWIKNQGRFYPYFLYEYFFSPTFRIYLSNISHVGTIAHYTITQLSETPISLPDIEEQIKVGEYFESLDRLITLHQRKYEELQKIKKFMLQNMFI